ncbi:MAG TPA: hypothetical protein VF936_11835 [Burkholderiales bacterium]
MADITTASLSDHEKRHLIVLRSLSVRRRENVMHYTRAIAALEQGRRTGADLQLVVDNAKQP